PVDQKTNADLLAAYFGKVTDEVYRLSDPHEVCQRMAEACALMGEPPAKWLETHYYFHMKVYVLIDSLRRFQPQQIELALFSNPLSRGFVVDFLIREFDRTNGYLQILRDPKRVKPIHETQEEVAKTVSDWQQQTTALQAKLEEAYQSEQDPGIRQK